MFSNLRLGKCLVDELYCHSVYLFLWKSDNQISLRLHKSFLPLYLVIISKAQCLVISSSIKCSVTVFSSHSSSVWQVEVQGNEPYPSNPSNRTHYRLQVTFPVCLPYVDAAWMLLICSYFTQRQCKRKKIKMWTINGTTVLRKGEVWISQGGVVGDNYNRCTALRRKF